MIDKIIIISFIVFAIHYSMQEGEIFGKLGAWFERNLPEKLKQPVFDCPVCMCPWYGSIIYWLVFAPMTIESLRPIRIIVPIGTWIEWIVVVIAAMGFNAIINKMFPAEGENNEEESQVKKIVTCDTEVLNKIVADAWQDAHDKMK